MNEIKENLKKITTKMLGEEDKQSIWRGILVEHIKELQNPKHVFFSIFSFRKVVIGMLAVFILIGTGGSGILAKSKNSLPGEFLFPVGLAVEKIQINLAPESKKNELKFQFAEDRIYKIKNVSKEKSIPKVLITDLSQADMLQMDAKVFKNETIVKITTSKEEYGYISALKLKADLIKEIASKYTIPEEKVNLLINLTVEDKDSVSTDKEFLNKTTSIEFSQKEIDDINAALTDVGTLVDSKQEGEKAQSVEKSLNELLVILGDESDLKVTKTDGDINVTKDKATTISPTVETTPKIETNNDAGMEVDMGTTPTSNETTETTVDNTKILNPTINILPKIDGSTNTLKL